jgi:hypothetical protein
MIDLSKITVPEEKLLVSLCRLLFTHEQKTEISEYTQEVTDWNYFTRLANEHGIIAIVAYNIKECGLVNKIPVHAMKILENGYMQSLVRNTWLTERWKEVNTILVNAGIKHILLKGMALEHSVYGSRGLRQMNDNDILLTRADALKAWHLLQMEGFTHELIKSSLHKKIIADTGKHLPSLFRSGYAIELHHNISDENNIYGQGLKDPFESAIEMLVDDTKALILSRVNHLAYLKKHFEKHSNEGHCQLRLYMDIILQEENNDITVPAGFISNPKQESNSKYRKTAYKTTVKSVPVKLRLRFLMGDIFPSLKWMKKRYACSGLKALLYYPARIGKVIWLV